MNPSTADWSRGALTAYLGADESAWADYDAVRLIENGARFPEILIDQGEADSFLEDGLRPWLLDEAVQGTDMKSPCACSRATITRISLSQPLWTTICAGTLSA